MLVECMNQIGLSLSPSSSTYQTSFLISLCLIVEIGMLIIILASWGCCKHEMRYGMTLSSIPSGAFVAPSLKAARRPHPGKHAACTYEHQIHSCSWKPENVMFPGWVQVTGNRIGSTTKQTLMYWLAKFLGQGNASSWIHLQFVSQILKF